MSQHVTIATSTGPLLAALLVHFGAGLIGLSSGFLALLVLKGGALHRRSGMVFVVAMITLGVMAAGIAAYERNWGSLFGGLFTAYFVFTGMTTVRPLAREPRGLAAALMLVATVVGLVNVGLGVVAAGTPGGTPGVPTPMYFFLGSILLLAAFGDLRVIRRGALTGSRRLTRHLWRMCFGLFIASGSFFFGQAQFLPKQLRSPALLAIPALAPLVLLLYWMWRVRVRQSLRGIVTARVAASATVR